ncbi:MAG: hypothetical protein HY072_10220 [Deltaproteobacteria bacterium]|nr:hypothetical protein [Deltaproteobacteria bacterium]
MKTITEYNGIELIDALRTMEMLTAAGKSIEEIHQTIGQATKREADKLQMFLNAIETIRNRAQGLKRVVVFVAGEKDRLPERSEKHGEHVFLPEYYPALVNSMRGRRDRSDFHRGERDGRGQRRPRGGRRDQDRFQKKPKNEVRMRPIPVTFVKEEVMKPSPVEKANPAMTSTEKADPRKFGDKKRFFNKQPRPNTPQTPQVQRQAVRPQKIKDPVLEAIRQEAEKRLKELNQT